MGSQDLIKITHPSCLPKQKDSVLINSLTTCLTTDFSNFFSTRYLVQVLNGHNYELSGLYPRSSVLPHCWGPAGWCGEI